jgi:hypothetical protein
VISSSGQPEAFVPRGNLLDPHGSHPPDSRGGEPIKTALGRFIKKLPRSVRATPVIAIAVTALIAGGTYALAAGGGTIHACAKKSNGALRVARKCMKSERSVTWNVRGPQGIQGPKGDAGPISPSNAYSSYKNAAVSLPSTWGTIAQLSVPAAGNYVINAKLVLHDDVNTPVGIACALVVGGDTLDQSATGLSGNTGDAVTDETAALQAVDQFTAAGEVDLQCNGFGVTTDASMIKITAIQIGSITNSASP